MAKPALLADLKFAVLIQDEEYFLTIQDGGKFGEKSCVKFNCKQIFLPNFTLEEFLMLPVRQSRTGRCRPKQLQYFIV